MAIAMLISTEIIVSNTAIIVRQRRIARNTIGKRACKILKPATVPGTPMVASVRGVSEKTPSGQLGE
jgi:hypothetical protein